MRVGIATVQVPFIHGGAESHVRSLLRAFKEAGHETEIITMPFRFGPANQLKRCMDVWQSEDFHQVNGYNMDRVVCMRFPAYYLKHDRKAAWVIHQHRAVYELWKTPFGDAELEADPIGPELRDDIFARDTKLLGACEKVFTVSRCVSDRLMKYNKVHSTPLLHPPPIAEHLYCDQAEAYILAPSRLESLKRLDLLIDAMRHVKQPVVAFIAGDGGQRDTLERKIANLNLSHKVKIVGNISADEMPRWYAKCLAVFFGPHQEDYGYITLEAMLAGKPVITCHDSGGPLEFVKNKQTGLVVEPDPIEVASAIEYLCDSRQRARDLGLAGLARYAELQISWPNVVQALI